MAPKAPVTTDPHALASIVTGLGGTVIPGPTFQFDIQSAKIREVVPKFDDLNIGVRRVSERIEQSQTRLRDAETITRLELYRRGE